MGVVIASVCGCLFGCFDWFGFYWCVDGAMINSVVMICNTFYFEYVV